MLNAEALQVAYGKSRVINDVSLAVGQGVGPFWVPIEVEAHDALSLPGRHDQ